MEVSNTEKISVFSTMPSWYTRISKHSVRVEVRVKVKDTEVLSKSPGAARYYIMLYVLRPEWTTNNIYAIK